VKRRRVIGAALGGLVLAGLVLRFGPAVTMSLVLGRPSAETWLERLAEDPARQEITLRSGDRAFHADLYRPANARSALLLVHGLSRAGRRHPDLMRLARLLARRRVLVLVPEFEGLTAFRLSGREVAEIGSGLAYLGTLSDHVGIAGFSFGAGPALLAAAEVPGLRVAGTFGGYADLRRVIAYITTGVHSFGGRRYAQRPEEYNRWKLLALLTGFLENERDRGLLQTIVERKLTDPSDDTRSLEVALGEEGQSVLVLALNRREDAVAPLLDRLPPGARRAIDLLSPLPAVARLSAPVLIAHGAEDDSIPFTESRRLAEAAGSRARVVIFRTFQHTGPRPFWDSLRQRAVDGWNLVRLIDELLTIR